MGKIKIIKIFLKILNLNKLVTPYPKAFKDLIILTNSGAKTQKSVNQI